MNQGDKATERARRFDFVRLTRPVGEHAAGAEGVVCDDASVDEGWVIIELVHEEGQPMWPEADAGSAKPGGAVLDANSYSAGRASDSKRRVSTLSMMPYSFASSAVMK
jgi:hypothetical protein